MNNIKDSIKYDISTQIGDIVNRQASKYIIYQIRREVWDHIWAQIIAETRSHARNQVWERVEDE